MKEKEFDNNRADLCCGGNYMTEVMPSIEGGVHVSNEITITCLSCGKEFEFNDRL